jgi:hypothetical protein
VAGLQPAFPYQFVDGGASHAQQLRRFLDRRQAAGVMGRRFVQTPEDRRGDAHNGLIAQLDYSSSVGTVHWLNRR